jgi:hypothetical protein
LKGFDLGRKKDKIAKKQDSGGMRETSLFLSRSPGISEKQEEKIDGEKR